MCGDQNGFRDSKLFMKLTGTSPIVLLDVSYQKNSYNVWFEVWSRTVSEIFGSL